MYDERLAKMMSCFFDTSEMHIVEFAEMHEPLNNALIPHCTYIGISELDASDFDEECWDLAICFGQLERLESPDYAIQLIHHLAKNQVYYIQPKKSKYSALQWLGIIPYRHFIMRRDELVIFNGDDLFQVPRCHLEDTSMNPSTIYRGVNAELAHQVAMRRKVW